MLMADRGETEILQLTVAACPGMLAGRPDQLPHPAHGLVADAPDGGGRSVS